jgi:DNA-binding CsgD family transcriptional regulator
MFYIGTRETASIIEANDPMFERFLRNFRQETSPQPVLSLDVELLLTLEQLAQEEQRGLNELAAELLWGAVSERHAAARNFRPWQELTPREKQTAALACLGHTNGEMAEIMVISTNTVKTHMRHVLRKFEVGSKSELREVLAGWDFGEWLETQELWTDMASSSATSL